MKQRKWVLCFLVLALVLSNVCMVGLAAGETPTLSISSGEVRAGESVTLTVSIEDNPGIAACLLYIYYDTAVFEVDYSSDILLTGDFKKEGGMFPNSIATAKNSSRYDGDMGKDGVLVLWYNSTGTETTANGAVLEIDLWAKAGAANGTYTVGLGYSKNSTCDQAGTKLDMKTVGGSVVVSGGAQASEDPVEEETEAPTFSDVSGHWAETEIVKAAELGLVEGYPNGTYGPDKTMTRAEFVTILWRSAGSPEPKGEASFTDLTQNWYKKAVAWAEENSIVNGTSVGKFSPTDPVTREQLVTILHRMVGAPVGMEQMWYGVYDSTFTDSASVRAYAREAVYWAIYKEIYCGESSKEVGTELKPREYANRAQIAVMMARYLDKY